ncbi:MAG: hypothetical protein FIA92_13090 [Chloroflexi bacterium]|nr:hypothetical protein [Chloroflexota bacterium]
MDTSLLQLMEELLQSIEQRDAGDPDAPAWEAAIRIQRLEEELSRRIATTEAGSGGLARPGSRGAGDEVLVGSA